MTNAVDSHIEKTHPRRLSSHKHILYFILALALIRGIIYAAVVPPWQAPDEPAQFERARAALTATEWNNTVENRPVWYDELRDSLFTFRFPDYMFDKINTTPEEPLNRYIALYHEVYQGQYGSRLPYAIIGLPLFLTRHHSLILQLYLVRLNTVLMGVIIILLAYLTTRIIFPDNEFLILGVPILILFIPQHTHMLSTVNNGNLAELLVTAALYFMVQGLIRGFSRVNILAIAVFSLMAMWTKATAYFLFVPLASIGLFYLWQHRQRWRWLLLTGIILAGLVYYFAPDRLKVLIFQAWSLLKTGEFYLDTMLPLAIFRSFWAAPGWATLQLVPLWYQLLSIVCFLAIGGLIILLVRKWKLFHSKQFQPKIQTLFVLGIAISAAIIVQVGWHILTGSVAYAQGRSLYPVIMPISIFLMLGWSQFIPVIRQKTGLLAMTIVFFLFDTLVLFSYIIPFFYSRY